MQKFKLYAIHKGHSVLITSFDGSQPTQINTTVTYDEQLSEAENDQFTLTFSMPRYLAVDVNIRKRVYNHWLDVVKMGSRLRLIIDDNRRIDFIVSTVAPALSRHNILYTFTAQDEISYLWSRHNLGYSYPGTDEEDDGPQCIAEYATRILRDNHLDSQGSVNWTPGPVVQDKFSFSTDNSNPYNAIVEAANVLGYKFHVNYTDRTLTFYIPEDNKFSGYRYRPETNLKSFSASYDATQLCTIMHAVGGTDAQEQIIPLTPALPHAFIQWFTEEDTNEVRNYNWDDPDMLYGEEDNPISSTKFGITDRPMPDNDIVSPYRIILDEIIQNEIDNLEEYGLDLEITNHKVEKAPYVLAGNDNPYKYFKGVVVSSAMDSTVAQNFANEQLQAEIDECVQFINIAEKIPYLGQFLCDFSFFDQNHSGLMTSEMMSDIDDILNRMRINNTTLKIYTPSYYNILYTIAKMHAQFETLAEQYQAEGRVIADKTRDEKDNIIMSINDIDPVALTSIKTVANKLSALFVASYYKLFTTVYGKDGDEPQITDSTVQYYYWVTDDDLADNNNEYEALKPIQTLGNIYPEGQEWVKQLEYAEKQYAVHQSKFGALDAKLEAINKTKTSTTEIDPNVLALQSEIESEKAYLKTFETLKSSGTIEFTDGNTIIVPGKGSLLLGMLAKTKNQYLDEETLPEQSLSKKIQDADQANMRQTERLYANYGDFIYETTYENTDELDSVGLYNQTVNNFALYNKPAASYSMTTIDLNCLEQISIPNATVGSKIRVYNELLNLKDGENNNLQYTNNDLTITAISRKLRSSDDVSFTVEKTNRINKLVEKLLINL